MKRNIILLFASALQLSLFTLLARWVHTHQVNRFDLTMTRSIQKRHNPVFFAISQCCTLLCSWQFSSVLAIPITVALWINRLRLEAITFACVSVSGTFFRKLLQSVVDRPRPTPALVHVTKKKSSPSFPSGHASTSIIGGGWLILLCNKFLKGRPGWQKAIISTLTALMFLSGPSRVYLGEHWTTDVTGGYLYGGSFLALTFSLYFTLHRRFPPPTHPL